jgi:hypothetical protein
MAVVGDDDADAPAGELAEAFGEFDFRPRVHGADGFVEDQDFDGTQEGTCQGDALPLAHTQFGPIDEPAAELRVIAVRKGGNDCIGSGAGRRGFDTARVPSPVTRRHRQCCRSH